MDSTSMTWVVNIAAGKDVTFVLQDGSNQLVYSSPQVIQSGGCSGSGTTSTKTTVKSSTVTVTSTAWSTTWSSTWSTTVGPSSSTSKSVSGELLSTFASPVSAAVAAVTSSLSSSSAASTSSLSSSSSGFSTASSSSLASVSMTNSTVVVSGTSSVITGIPVTGTTQDDDGRSDSKASPDAAKIVGLALGIAALLGALLLLFIVIRSKRRRRKQQHDTHGDGGLRTWISLSDTSNVSSPSSTIATQKRLMSPASSSSKNSPTPFSSARSVGAQGAAHRPETDSRLSFSTVSTSQTVDDPRGTERRSTTQSFFEYRTPGAPSVRGFKPMSYVSSSVDSPFPTSTPERLIQAGVMSVIAPTERSSRRESTPAEMLRRQLSRLSVNSEERDRGIDMRVSSLSSSSYTDPASSNLPVTAASTWPSAAPSSAIFKPLSAVPSSRLTRSTTLLSRPDTRLERFSMPDMLGPEQASYMADTKVVREDRRRRTAAMRSGRDVPKSVVGSTASWHQSSLDVADDF